MKKVRVHFAGLTISLISLIATIIVVCLSIRLEVPLELFIAYGLPIPFFGAVMSYLAWSLENISHAGEE